VDMEYWMLWLALAAICIVGEIFTAGFFLLWFGIGAAVACVLAVVGVSTGWQWASFIVISGVLFLVSRKFSEKLTKKQPPGIGADRNIGKQGVVLEEINNENSTGRIRLEREEWRAESENNEVISIGEKVIVIRLDGTHLIVERIEKGD
jgi:membrane protein implicated in regulation of membrane protease activity